MPPLGIVVVLAFAVYRLARILPSDSIALPLRERLYEWAWDTSGPRPAARKPLRTYVYDFVTCQHCQGVWLAVIVYCAWRWGGDVALAIIAVVAVAGVQSTVASFTIKADE